MVLEDLLKTRSHKFDFIVSQFRLKESKHLKANLMRETKLNKIK